MKIVTLILLLSYNICALKYQRVVVAKHFLCPSPCSLNSKSNSDEDASTDLTEVYSKWAAEEEELHKQSSITTNDSFDDDGGDLPEYMKKLVGKFENEFSGNAVPVPASKLPTIAIIGRPNTGKSTIVNKLSDSYKDGAIVHDEAGITRDRTYRTGMWNNYNFQIIDTGGIVFDDAKDTFADRITEQALLALDEATVAMMVCDGKEGVTQLDSILADWLRKNQKIPIFLAVNKCESETQGLAQAQDFWELGLGNPYPVSGIHGTGMADLLDEITSNHFEKVLAVAQENATNIALVGRPNVGKSSLFNRLYGATRSIVSEVAGTTRDAVDVLVNRGNKTYRLIDTAGIRKKKKIEYGAEYFMVNRAFKAIRRADVVVLLLDATDGIVEQDRVLAERIADEGRSCVIALNKWDAVPDKDDKTYLKAVDNVRSSLPVLRWAEVVLISGLTGLRTEKLLEAVDRAAEQFRRRVPTAIINEVVQEATLWMAPPTIGSRSGRIYYCIQTSAAPATIVFFVNDPALFTDNYQRYLERKIRDALKFEGAPIRMVWRGKTLRTVGRSELGDLDGAKLLRKGK